MNQAGDYLLSSRPEGKPYAGYWEFAGGKVEANESEFAALQREFAEELGITIHRAKPWLTKVHVYEHAHVHLRFFGLRQTIGRAKCKLKKGNNGLGNEQGILMCRRCCLRMVQFWRHWQCLLLSEVICNKAWWGIMVRVNIGCCLISALKGIAKRCC